MPKPTKFPRWANSDVNDPISSAPNKREPSDEFKNTGQLRNQPLFRDHVNYEFNLINQWIEYLDTVNSTITEDKTLYVSTTGSDVTGTGDILLPFATPHKAIDSLIGSPIATDALVTIFCAAGVYNFTESITINHPYGERIHIIGDTLVGVKPFNFPIADWSSDRENPVVPARGADEYYGTSGTLPVSETNVNRKLARGSDLSNNKVLVQARWGTIFNFTGTSGIEIQGNNSIGLVDKIAMIGAWDGVLDVLELYQGIDSGDSTELEATPLNVTGGTAFIGGDVVVIGFEGDAVRARYGAAIVCADGFAVVNNMTKGFNASGVSVIVANGSVAVGNGGNHYSAFASALVRAQDSKSSGSGVNGYSASNAGMLRVKGSASYGSGSHGYGLSVGSVLSGDISISRGSKLAGISMTAGCSSDADSMIISDNGTQGIQLEGSNFDGQTLTIENNGTIGISCKEGSSANVSLSTIQNNDGDELDCRRTSNITITSSTIPSGSTVTAFKNSYIAIANTAGVTYSPAYGVVGNDEALINT